MTSDTPKHRASSQSVITRELVERCLSSPAFYGFAVVALIAVLVIASQ